MKQRADKLFSPSSLLSSHTQRYVTEFRCQFANEERERKKAFNARSSERKKEIIMFFSLSLQFLGKCRAKWLQQLFSVSAYSIQALEEEKASSFLFSLCWLMLIAFTHKEGGKHIYVRTASFFMRFF